MMDDIFSKQKREVEKGLLFFTSTERTKGTQIRSRRKRRFFIRAFLVKFAINKKIKRRETKETRGRYR